MRATSLCLPGLLICLCAVAGAEVLEESFEDGAARWEAVGGEWIAEDGGYLQRDASCPGYRMSLFDTQFREGLIETTAVPLARNDHGNVGTTFGLVLKHIDDERWLVARYGSYGNCSVVISEPEGRRVISFGEFTPEVGSAQRARALISNGKIAFIRGGAVISILHDPFPEEAGRPGLFTETACRFEYFRIEQVAQ